MRRKLVLLGGGDFAKELEWIASLIPDDSRDWELGGYLDDDEATARRPGLGLPYLGPIRGHRPEPGLVYCPAIGSPRTKLTVCEAVRALGGEFVNILHPSAVVGPRSRVGSGVVMAQYVTVSVDVTIGDFVAMNFNCTTGHDAVVEDGCTISSYCDVTGHVHLERGVFLGSHASVLPGKRVGAFATVGAGSAVMRNVATERTVVGVPAKVML
ncbi:MAG: acetyltransferase [Gemmatimonadetes bacterium]|nr:acetyltransferase [Gemmatimonadota bacterium]